MVLRSLIFLIVLSCASAKAFSQTWPFEIWHEGKIVLIAGDTLRGLVKYDLHKDLVEYSWRDNSPEVYTARKVAFFEIFDESIKRYRRFFTLPFQTTAGYKSPIFFELLEDGKMTLLAREHLETRTYSSPYYIGSYQRLVLVNRFFFIQENGDIAEFTGNKNDLLDLMGRQKDDVEKFMKNNHLKIDDKEDFSRIINYYNSLVKT